MTLRQKVDPSLEADVLAVRQLLGLDPAGREFQVVYGAVAANDKQIAILSRSILEILVDLSSFIDVPEAHVTDRRVTPTADPEVGPSGPIRPLIRIGSSPDRPADAFLAVPYRGYWFWIDDRDMASKRLFTFLMFIFTLVETGGKDNAPGPDDPNAMMEVRVMLSASSALEYQKTRYGKRRGSTSTVSDAALRNRRAWCGARASHGVAAVPAVPACAGSRAR